MRVRPFWKPRSRRLDRLVLEKGFARGFIENQFRVPCHLTSTIPSPLPSKNSSIRPGVPMTISEPWNRNFLISSAGEPSEETRSRVGGYTSGGWSSEPKEDETALRVP
jgi:hypothetical protein